ncbi:PAS domain-containing protein [Pseudomonas entomophila]|uniref:helix-turn-helix transcriptional regulator n=1 Tax=Pseudomonas entomophila TaxID=312306 RepID=UPI0023D88598|nr:PAS domain-containing protein [Pseudomonas entomophila]MDF0732917.1 PAS domain-containing protein [Pseudomonas entomophila]
MHTLDNYKAIADGIATLFFPHVEVILHEVSSRTIVHIANNFSKRRLGDDSALDDLPADFAEVANLGPYEKLNWDGQKLRSISSVLKNAHGEPEYLMCLNMNVSVLEQARDALDAFFQISRLIPQPEALFKDDWQERINTFLHAWLKERQLALNTLSMKHKRELVEALHAEGAFEGRSGADYVANVLNMGRATVYKYLKPLRANG